MSSIPETKTVRAGEGGVIDPSAPRGHSAQPSKRARDLRLAAHIAYDAAATLDRHTNERLVPAWCDRRDKSEIIAAVDRFALTGRRGDVEGLAHGVLTCFYEIAGMMFWRLGAGQEIKLQPKRGA